MSIACAVGRGKAADGLAAGRQAAYACHLNLEGLVPDLLILFASSGYDQVRVLAGIRDFYPHAPLAGCSTAGEIWTEGPEEHSVVLAAVSGLTVQVERGGSIAEDPRAAGEKLGEKLAPGRPRAVLMFADGLAGNGAAVVRGLQERLPPPAAVIGGAAGDDFLFQQTYQYFNDEVLTQTVCGVGLSGDFNLGIGVRHGWEPVGQSVVVTKSQGHRLLEINDQPAIRFYEDYFGEYAGRLRREPLARMAVAYPLGQAVAASTEYLLRIALSADAEGAIQCAAEIPEGSAVRLMIGSIEGAVAAARIAAMEALAQMRGTYPRLALIFNCIGRRRVLGRRAGEEIATIRDIIGRQVPVLGFYTYGEIAPLEGIQSNPSCFHNETVVIVTLG